MAHYEPLRQVINLTKKNGAGCMAHEWFHALDNWAQYSAGRAGYATEATTTAATTAAERAGAALLQAIRKTEFFRRSQNLAIYKGDYWVKAIELAARGFESVCAFLLRVSGVCSDFLVNCLDMDEFTAKDAAHRSDFYPYPTEAEAATLATYYFALLRAIFGEGVHMSESVRREVARLTTTAESEQSEAQAEREAQHAAEEAKRAEMMAAAKDHAAALTAASRAKVEGRTEEVKAETGADWSHVFENCGKCYAIGGGRGFVFLVYASGAVSFRIIKENNRIKKDFRPSHRYYIDVRRGVDLRAVMVADANRGFCPASLCYELFNYSYAMSWAEFSAKFADELAAAQGVKDDRAEITEVAQPAQKTESAPVQAADNATTDEAPAEGLQLVETAEGVAVIGDSRTTYRNRKAIKAHGATWNKEEKQWQASEPEAVALLREWFVVSATPTAEEADTANESEPKKDAPTAPTAQGEHTPTTTSDNTEPTESDSTTAQPGANATLCEAGEITDTAPTDTAEDFGAVLAADRLELLRRAAEDFDRLTQAGEHIAAVNARLSALFACGVDVADIATIAANISPESVGERSLTSCALEAIRMLNSTASRRAARVLTPEEWQALFGTPHHKQHAA